MMTTRADAPANIAAAVAAAKPALPVVEAKFVGGYLGYQWGILVDGAVTKYGLCLSGIAQACDATHAELAALT